VRELSGREETAMKRHKAGRVRSPYMLDAAGAGAGGDAQSPKDAPAGYPGQTARDAARKLPPGSGPDDPTATGKPAGKRPERSLSARTTAQRSDDSARGRREA
jgi:hypothetical protein